LSTLCFKKTGPSAVYAASTSAPAFAIGLWRLTRRKVRHYSVLVFYWTSQCPLMDVV